MKKLFLSILMILVVSPVFADRGHRYSPPPPRNPGFNHYHGYDRGDNDCRPYYYGNRYYYRYYYIPVPPPPPRKGFGFGSDGWFFYYRR